MTHFLNFPDCTFFNCMFFWFSWLIISQRKIFSIAYFLDFLDWIFFLVAYFLNAYIFDCTYFWIFLIARFLIPYFIDFIENRKNIADVTFFQLFSTKEHSKSTPQLESNPAARSNFSILFLVKITWMLPNCPFSKFDTIHFSESLIYNRHSSTTSRKFKPQNHRPANSLTKKNNSSRALLKPYPINNPSLNHKPQTNHQIKTSRHLDRRASKISMIA